MLAGEFPIIVELLGHAVSRHAGTFSVGPVAGFDGGLNSSFF